MGDNRGDGWVSSHWLIPVMGGGGGGGDGGGMIVVVVVVVGLNGAVLLVCSS